MKKIATLVIVGVGGCATEPPVQPVNVIGSDLCTIQSTPLSWDVKDTAPTITGIRRFNAKWASRCARASPST